MSAHQPAGRPALHFTIAGTISPLPVSILGMTYKKWILRILRVTAFSVLGVVLLLFAAVQIQQHLLRWRAERQRI